MPSVPAAWGSSRAPRPWARHGAPGPDGTSHLHDGAGRIWHEIEDQPSDGHIKARGIDGQ